MIVGLVYELTSLRVDKVIVDLVGLVDELTSLRVDKVIAINLLTRKLVNYQLINY